jgi:hypothetical protein
MTSRFFMIFAAMVMLIFSLPAQAMDTREFEVISRDQGSVSVDTTCGRSGPLPGLLQGQLDEGFVGIYDEQPWDDDADVRQYLPGEGVCLCRHAVCQHCFCGNSYGKYGQAANCDMKCSGNAGEICGGSFANSVYSIK